MQNFLSDDFPPSFFVLRQEFIYLDDLNRLLFFNLDIIRSRDFVFDLNFFSGVPESPPQREVATPFNTYPPSAKLRFTLAYTWTEGNIRHCSCCCSLEKARAFLSLRAHTLFALTSACASLKTEGLQSYIFQTKIGDWENYLLNTLLHLFRQSSLIP